MTVTDEAVEAAARAIYEQNPCGEQDFDADFRPTGTGYVIKFDALPEYDAGLYELSLNQARAALEAAAPHMLPAPEGVSEAEKALHDLCSWLDKWDRRDNDTAKNIRTVLSALSSERERAERLADERERLILLICGGEDAPGYAASLTFDQVKAAHDDYIAMVKSRAEAAEAKVKEGAELLGLTVEALEAARVFAQDAIEQNPTPSGVLGNLYGIRDAVDGAHAAEARMFIRHADHLTRQAALHWTEEASQGEGE